MTTASQFALTPPAIPIQAVGRVRVIAPTEIIVGNRQMLKQVVLDFLAAGERQFVFDFSDTGYIDASGLGVLVSIAKRVRDAGGRLVLCALNEDLKTLMQLTKLDALFVVADTVARGLEYLGQAR